MPTEHHVIEFEGGQFLVELDHDNALKLLSDSGKVLPAIPAGANALSERLRTNDGRLAAVIMQTGSKNTRPTGPRGIGVKKTEIRGSDSKWTIMERVP